MNITIFDMIDGGHVAAVLVVFAMMRAWYAHWAVLCLVLFHVAGRGLLFHNPHGFFWLSTGAMLFAAGNLLAPVLTNWGRLVGCLWAVVSIAAMLHFVGMAATPLQGGLHLDTLNFISACLTAIAWAMILGMLRHDALCRANGLDA